MALSLHSILTVCHQHGVDFRLEGDRVVHNHGTTEALKAKVGEKLYPVLVARKVELKQFFIENPDWKPGDRPAVREAPETEEGSGESKKEEAPPAATPVAPGQGQLPLSAPAVPPPGPIAAAVTAAVAEAKQEVTRVALVTNHADLSESTHAEIRRLVGKAPIAQCPPCRMVYYYIDPEHDPDPLHCLRCGARLKKPEARS